MQRITYTNPLGGTVTLDAYRPYFLGDVQGSASITYTLTPTAKAGYGDAIQNIAPTARPLILTGMLLDCDYRDIYEARREIAGVLNPELCQHNSTITLGTVRYENDAGTYEISGVPQAFELSREAGGLGLSLELTINCPYPKWKGIKWEEDRLAYVTGGLRYPKRYPNRYGTMAGQIIINNSGTAYTPVTITISGYAVNPTITNLTTGDVLPFDVTLEAGDTMEISTSPEKDYYAKIIRADGTEENAYRYVKPSMNLLHLAPGENVIQYSVSGNETRKIDKIGRYPHYAGV